MSVYLKTARHLLVRSARVIHEEGWRSFIVKAWTKMHKRACTLNSPIEPDTCASFDVVLPVTTSYTVFKATLDSVLSCTEGKIFTVFVLTDPSTDMQIRSYLKYLQTREPHVLTRDSLMEKPMPKVVEIFSPRYLGFVEQINHALANTKRDVVLLYGAVILSPRSLDRLQATAYSDASIAGVVPLSEAFWGIVSGGEAALGDPGLFCLQQPVEVEFNIQTLPIPTLIGPCMYIKQEALDEVPTFGPDFSTWSHAKNAFSMELRRRGRRFVLDLSTFVYSCHSASPRDEIVECQYAADTSFRDRYPDFLSLLRDFVYHLDVIRCSVPRLYMGLSKAGESRGARFQGRRAQTLRVGIEAQLLAHKWQVGTRRYTEELIKNLLKGSNKNLYVLYTAGDILSREEYAGCVKKFVVNSTDILLDNTPIDVFHCPNHSYSIFDVLTLAKFKASVITIHDLILYHRPDYHSTFKEYATYRQLMELSVQVADRIIAVSENTKRDLVENLGVSPEKVHVVYLGIDFNRFNTDDKLMNISSTYNIDSEYILYVGTNFPHKNLRNLVAAFEKLIRTKRLPHVLVLVGSSFNSFERKALSGLAERLGGRLRLLGHVPDTDLPALYRNASLFVFPSLYEGFGIPPLEAMACGTPVVASNATSIPEVVGDAALVVDCTDVDELAEAMHRALTDKHLRQSLIKAGFERARTFRWENTARKTARVYKIAYERNVSSTRRLSETAKSKLYKMITQEVHLSTVLQNKVREILDMI